MPAAGLEVRGEERAERRKTWTEVAAGDLAWEDTSSDIPAARALHGVRLVLGDNDRLLGQLPLLLPLDDAVARLDGWREWGTASTAFLGTVRDDLIYLVRRKQGAVLPLVAQLAPGLSLLPIGSWLLGTLGLGPGRLFRRGWLVRILGSAVEQGLQLTDAPGCTLELLTELGVASNERLEFGDAAQALLVEGLELLQPLLKLSDVDVSRSAARAAGHGGGQSLHFFHADVIGMDPVGTLQESPAKPPCQPRTPAPFAVSQDADRRRGERLRFNIASPSIAGRPRGLALRARGAPCFRASPTRAPRSSL